MKTYKQFMSEINRSLTPKDFTPPGLKDTPHLRTDDIKSFEKKHFKNYMKNILNFPFTDLVKK